MKKIASVSILILVLTTSLVKNSTKKIEDKTSAINENISLLNTELGDVMLEYNYLSSPDKLTQYQVQYFENELIKINIIKIKKISKKNELIKLSNFLKINE
tara:strand:+ start:288 stop:590 length:303 start_codon:yes stop_codon:yes gene_type:complete